MVSVLKATQQIWGVVLWVHCRVVVSDLEVR